MFHSLCAGLRKISEPLRFHYLDIAELNRRVLSGVIGVFKVSFATFFDVEDHYRLLNTGAALGFGCGPLLLRRPGLKTPNQDSLVAIPGKNTTAFALLKNYYPHISKFIPMRFDEIPRQMHLGNIDYGLVIHETRFVYESMGLELVTDLGELFESDTSSPIPLGAIAVHRSLEAFIEELQDAIRNSILDSNREFPLEFCMKYAQEMDEAVLRDHIKTYVNDYSLHLDETAMSGIDKLRLMCVKS